MFLLWLMGFASYYVAAAVTTTPAISISSAIIAIVAFYVWQHPRFANHYDIEHYPLLIISFTAMVICTQAFKIAGKKFTHAVSFLANYSFSLYLVHFTIVKAMFQLTDQVNPLIRLFACLIAANVIAVGFSWLFEQRYRKLAGALKRALFAASEYKQDIKTPPLG